MPGSFKSHIGFGKESTWGTAVAPTIWIPSLNYAWNEERRRELDEGDRAKAAKDFGAYDGVRFAKPSYEFHFYPDEVSRFIARILGQDAVSGAGPYTHTMTLADKGASDTIADFYGIAAAERRMPGMYVEKFDLKYQTDQGFLNSTIGFCGQVPGAPLAESTPTFPTSAPYVSWQNSLTINAGSNVKLLSFELSLGRPVEVIFGANSSQDPNAAEVGVLEVTGRVAFYALDDSEYNLFRNNTQTAIVVTFTSGTNTLTITLTNPVWEKALPDRSGVYLRWDCTFRGLYNATDAGPCKIVSVNGASAQY